jgi:flavin-binding protein dodecin
MKSGPRRALAAALLVGLSGCSAVSMDAAAAIAIAKAEGTPAALARIPCYQAIGTLTATQVKDVLSLYEAAQGGEDLAQGPCALVIAGIAVQVLQHTPVIIPVP